MWSMALLFGIIFIFAVCFVQSTTELLSRDASEADAAMLRARDGARIYWSNIGKAILSLFFASTGGDDWAIIAEPLYTCGAHIYGFFIFYIAIFYFVITNSVTGLIVDSFMAVATKDEETIIAEQISKKKEHMARLVKLFESMHSDGSQEVTLQEFVKHLADPRIEAFAASLEIETEDLEQFFSILSGAGRRTVDLETFVVGCIKLGARRRAWTSWI